MSAPIRLKLTGIVMALALGMLALNVQPAAAKTGYANICPVLGTALCTPGTLTYTDGGVAVDNSSSLSAGDVWFASGDEGAPLALLKFDESGNELLEVNSGDIPAPAAPFSLALTGIAVDPANGDVYAADRGGTVTKFESSGVFQFQITGSGTPQGSFFPMGVAVDPADGDLYVADGAHEVVDRFTSSGTFIEQFKTPATPIVAFLGGIAFGPEDNLYVSSSGEVGEYSATGAPVGCPGGASSVHPTSGTGGIAVDPSDGHSFVAEKLDLVEYSSLCAAAPNVTLGAGEFGETSFFGVGVNGSTHEVYASAFHGANGLIFGLVTVPSLATGVAPENITRTSAVVSGTVNPEGAPVTVCEFEYGQTEAYGQSAPCSSPHEVSGSEPLTGSAAIAVSAELKFPALPPASKVYYRLRAGNGAGAEVDNAQTFYTEALPVPVIGSLPASSVTQSAATLNGTLGTGEALVDYHFEYGTTTSYGLIAPVPDAYTPITTETLALSQPVSGLQAGTTYHYRLVASSPGGTEVKGPDETFTTLSIPAPAVATGASEGVGVGSATLTGTVDPHGWDTTYLFQYGTSTTYGSSWPSIEVDMGALEGAQPVVVSVPNLLPDTTYHYRLIATSGGGTSYGPDVTFTTTEYPASIIQEAPLVSLPKVTTTTITKTKSETKAQKLAKALKACGKDKNKGKREVCERAAHKDFGTKQKGKAKKK